MITVYPHESDWEEIEHIARTYQPGRRLLEARADAGLLRADRALRLHRAHRPGPQEVAARRLGLPRHQRRRPDADPGRLPTAEGAHRGRRPDPEGPETHDARGQARAARGPAEGTADLEATAGRGPGGLRGEGPRDLEAPGPEPLPAAAAAGGRLPDPAGRRRRLAQRLARADLAGPGGAPGPADDLAGHPRHEGRAGRGTGRWASSASMGSGSTRPPRRMARLAPRGSRAGPGPAAR
jgi:hypothetical protein